jgi:hypothetical protein
MDKYKFTLQTQEKEQREAMTSKGTHAAHKLLAAG